ncbi:MAG: hypothetical protein QOE54_6210, partial [Streptosporangiaceae bacterium]|nr:hypothetical protein [Streptosporangiaceae bacterium]
VFFGLGSHHATSWDWALVIAT